MEPSWGATGVSKIGVMVTAQAYWRNQVFERKTWFLAEQLRVTKL